MANKEELEAMGISETMQTKKDYNNRNNQSTQRNQIATVLKAFSSIIMIICVITFLALIVDNFFTGLIILISGVISGIFILGFAEVIQKLQNIEDNTRK